MVFWSGWTGLCHLGWVPLQNLRCSFPHDQNFGLFNSNAVLVAEPCFGWCFGQGKLASLSFGVVLLFKTKFGLSVRSRLSAWMIQCYSFLDIFACGCFWLKSCCPCSHLGCVPMLGISFQGCLHCQQFSDSCISCQILWLIAWRQLCIALLFVALHLGN